MLHRYCDDQNSLKGCSYDPDGAESEAPKYEAWFSSFSLFPLYSSTDFLSILESLQVCLQTRRLATMGPEEWCSPVSSALSWNTWLDHHYHIPDHHMYHTISYHHDKFQIWVWLQHLHKDSTQNPNDANTEHCLSPCLRLSLLFIMVVTILNMEKVYWRSEHLILECLCPSYKTPQQHIPDVQEYLIKKIFSKVVILEINFRSEPLLPPRQRRKAAKQSQDSDTGSNQNTPAPAQVPLASLCW